MNTNRLNTIQEIVDSLDSALQAHDLLLKIYGELIRGSIKLPDDIECELDRYFGE